MNYQPFFNNRIEQVFSELYKGRNQIIFTDGIDDLFLIQRKKSPGLYPLEEALVECGKKRDYDIIITVKEDLSLAFGSPEQEALFHGMRRVSKIPDNHRAVMSMDFGRRTRDAAQSGASASAPEPEKKENESVRQAKEAGKKMEEINRLERITEVLNKKDKRVLVIFPYPDNMIKNPSAGGDMQNLLKKMEIILKNWRSNILDAHPDSRSILIINPHLLDEFQALGRRVSCYDHSYQIIRIGLPEKEEMKAWLKNYYAPRNAITGEPREWDRVVLTGKTQPDFNLQNFVGWVQAFFQKKDTDGSRKLATLLKAENVDAAESKEDILEKLDEMIGLDEVKKKIKEIVVAAETKKNAADSNYHMLFLGSPGTGKTVVAELIAKLFWAMGIRTSRKTVSIKFHDIIGEYNEGEAIQRMKAKVAEAMGGVLFVDEAYQFAESEWGKKAFQVLLTEMENHRDNLTVILAGYENRLQALYDINEGFESRIPTKLYFHDYTKEEKLKIFYLHLKRFNDENHTGIVLSKDAEPDLMRIMDRLGGNARGVRDYLQKKLLEKLPDGKTVIERKDITDSDPHKIDTGVYEKVMADIDREFYGMNSLKKQLHDFFENIKFNAERSEMLNLPNANRPSYRLRFTGPPGTGKTSIARHMGKFFHAMGITETDECKECGATMLKGAYVGHAQQAVNRLFHENRGKVIFIDEIYSLYNPSDGQDDQFGREAIDTLVRNLTAEEYRDTVVIVAGYKDKVEVFLKANPGLASRFNKEIEFQKYSADECVEIFRKIAEGQSYLLKDEAKAPLKKIFSLLCKQDDFGNARTVNEVLGQVIDELVSRLQNIKNKSADDYRDILKQDVEAVLKKTEAPDKRSGESKVKKNK